MKATDILEEMGARGVKLWAESDLLKFDAPADVLTGEDKARLIEHKPALLALLLTRNSSKPEPVADDGRRPYLTEGNELIIPTFTPKRYRWWQGGQSIWATLAELNAPLATWCRNAANHEDLLSSKHAERCIGEVHHAEGFVFCVECGRYAKKLEAN